MHDRTTCLEFDCPSCGQHAVVMSSDPRVQPRCHACRMLPGWHRRPEIVAGFEIEAALMAADAAALIEEAA